MLVSAMLAAHALALHGEGVARAQVAQGSPTTSVGSSALARARAAWDRGDFDVAEPLYKDAIEQGGLQASELLDAYVHLGAARGVLGRKDGALAAFRRAALLDGKFRVPPEAGKKAQALAETARREQARLGAVTVRLTTPESVPMASPFRVRATLDAVHVAVVGRVAVDVRDATTGARHAASQPAATDLVFEVPARLTAVDGNLSVIVTAFDTYENQLTVSRARVVVPRGEKVSAPAPVAVQPGLPLPSRSDAGEKPGFWSSPWPYIVGGVALAAGGSALYFAFRPATDVNVGAAQVQTLR